MNLAKRIVEVLEKHDINLLSTAKQNGEYITGMEFYSDAGEDFVFDVWHDRSTKSFVDAFEVYANDFDPDEHAEMWLECRGKGGCPTSIRALIDDADSISEKLNTIATELNTVYYR